MTTAEVSRSPWFSSNGYRACTVRYSDGTTRTVYEHRELVERAIGRRLERNEHVHHRDGVRDNNNLSNLELLSSSEHAREHARPVEFVRLTCLLCGSLFQRRAKDERANRKKGKAGPYCSKRCSGVVSGRVFGRGRPLSARGAA